MKHLIAMASMLLIIASCSKKEEMSSLEILKSSSSYVNFDIPNEISTDSPTGEISIVEDEIIMLENGVEVSKGWIKYAYSENDLLEIKISSELYTFIESYDDSEEFDEQIFTEGIFSEEILFEWNNKEKTMKRTFGEWLRHVFIGDPFTGPCLWGQADNCWDHWLIGTYGCEQGPC